MTLFLLRLVQACHLIGAVSLSVLAVGAGLGFANPLLDSLNHFQLLWFFGTLGALLTAVPLYSAYRVRALLMAVTATGFLASAIIVIPEALAGFLPMEPRPTDQRPVYRLMTYNMFGRNDAFGEITEMIAKDNPDILTLQEFFPEQRSALGAILDKAYPYNQHCTGQKRSNIAIFARIPFTLDKNGDCSSADNGRTAHLIAVFSPPGQPAFRVMTTHLDWPLQISQFRQGENLWDSLNRMTARQQEQFADLAKAVEAISGPLIVAGDFNSTSWSYTLRGFVRAAGLTRHTHNLWTYPKLFYIDGWRKTPAFLPLDQVLSKDGIEVHDIHTGRPAGSDHLPVVVDFSITGSAI